jgi:3-hydroxyacyl-[acyl-carrier-protein] dehydratase
MRFLFCDRITSIEKGKAIEGVKTFSLSEECFRGHFSKRPIIPAVLYIEAMAQLLGWLITYSHDFQCSAILSLIENASVDTDLRPGFQARIHGEIISSTANDTLGRASIEVNGAQIAGVDRIIYNHFRVEDPQALQEHFIYCSGWENSPRLHGEAP